MRARERDSDFEFTLSDLPGYGYAKVPAHLREHWKPLIEGYLEDDALRGVVQLIDARRPPTVDDATMMTFLADRSMPTLVALTKVDKLKGNERRRELDARMNELGLDREQVVPVSAITGEGCDLLLDSLAHLIGPDS